MRTCKLDLNKLAFGKASLFTSVAVSATLLGSLPVTAPAITIQVPADQPTIQQAVNAANNGDTVLVSPGTYFENLNYQGKAISVQSINGPMQTIIDGNNAGSVVKFQTHEGSQSVLNGFTIQHGNAGVGAGIFMADASPTITNNIFRDNVQQSGGFGAAIGSNGSSPVIEGNTFLTNSCDTQPLSGVVVFANWSSPRIINNIFRNNPCRAITLVLNAVSSAVIANNTIVLNSAGMLLSLGDGSFMPLFCNNILTSNGVGLRVGWITPGQESRWLSNLVFQNTTNYSGIADQTGLRGNISADPRFVSIDDFQLQPGSPAIDAGRSSVPDLPPIDFLGHPRIVDGDGNGLASPDLGVYEFNPNPSTPTATPIPTSTPAPTRTPTATPIPTPIPTPTPTPSPILVAIVFLPTTTIDTSTTNFNQPVLTSVIDASDNLIGFQGDLTFDSSVVMLQSPPVSGAGLTASNWNVSGNVIPGSGPIRTLRISAFSNDFTPLSGSGTLFNLNMTRVGSTPGANTALAWAAPSQDFIFVDDNLNRHAPGSTPPGSITIQLATPTPLPILVAIVSLPAATIATSNTNFTQSVITSAIAAGDNLIGFQGDFTFDERVIAFQIPPVSNAELTGDWNVSGNVLPGAGPMRTLRILAFSNDVTPLSGSGTLFNLNMIRVSSTPGESTVLAWAEAPRDFIFIDGNLDVHAPGSTPPGSITIQGTTINISGNISCSNSSPGPVPGVTLTLTGSTSSSTLSDGSGNYMFLTLASGGSYTVTPMKSPLTLGSPGITTLDVIATQAHFFGLTLLTGSPLIAADVNGDTLVDTADTIAIQRFVLGLSTGTANVGKYQFSPTSRTYPGIDANQTDQHYDTLIFGDVAAPFAER